MRIACWVSKATETQTERAIIIPYPWQQCLGEHASILRLHMHFLSCYGIIKLLMLFIHIQGYIVVSIQSLSVFFSSQHIRPHASAWKMRGEFF